MGHESPIKLWSPDLTTVSALPVSSGRSGRRRIKVGAWRDDSHPMQVVSGPVGHELVHFEAPTAARAEREMTGFLDWFNRGPGIDPVLEASIARLWFMTIHPFDNGNGRIAHAIADLSLARSERSSQRFYCMPAQIWHEHNAYYDMLEQTQRGETDNTRWLTRFLEWLGRAIDGAEMLLASSKNRYDSEASRSASFMFRRSVDWRASDRSAS
jgi:Fic family protein